MSRAIPLPKPVPATVTTPFFEYQVGQRVTINKVTSTGLMLGAEGSSRFLPCSHVNAEARASAKRLLKAAMNGESPPKS
ncbi:MAG: hypothetical protein A3B10_04200 [Candidatus Doudnabacteria bacterium RIFCSPLOWO2_01_FULL_44_21]|uniref:Uncharacterized protein n=1 Tax=Candidatus Doudnabacteria bacterium RIFCSPLOWO2_01_FULL_44_21 TaxID=1817841 RepID=A0A1F5Q5A4_9BACT|nr:MAG: hypothetical protein A3B95_00430 [Candidatus Doudnabacteria bacterium RIFCSPHIGHO2_02_FULL_43_13b]OGE97316.1 MAG: hypothetical protein A3B10_04200 [Candidatus Doudnabacteria bacterium RIFCSPLOWO2_01_FULL_44_21]